MSTPREYTVHCILYTYIVIYYIIYVYIVRLKIEFKPLIIIIWNSDPGNNIKLLGGKKDNDPRIKEIK